MEPETKGRGGGGGHWAVGSRVQMGLLLPASRSQALAHAGRSVYLQYQHCQPIRNITLFGKCCTALSTMHTNRTHEMLYALVETVRFNVRRCLSNPARQQLAKKVVNVVIDHLINGKKACLSRHTLTVYDDHTQASLAELKLFIKFRLRLHIFSHRFSLLLCK